MAALETTRPMTVGGSLSETLNRLTFGTIARVFAWNNARVTRNALHKLTNRELDDIGLNRSEIEHINF